MNRLEPRLAAADVVASGVKVDLAFMHQVGEQVEARVDAVLRQIYVLPLVNPMAPALGAIVEKFICAEVIVAYFSGQGIDTILEYAASLKQQAESELQEYASGEMALPGELLDSTPASYRPNMSQAFNRMGTAQTVDW